ncbi:hypothetical protein [Pseudomonas segetis]|uniref:Uncharacterized protein n=1 Tax=Pseudomonas segetis TaxID=298908 RepID=A0A239GM22_9PSED|nr:hypothetical protein [Pseudomonas segetis]SNS70031.1 hypothetical protein SAMN05216255_3044 [Pseudomonas segetis]
MNLIKPPVIPDRLTWEYAHEPELISWTIRARSYNTFVANLIFWFFFTVALCLAYFMYSPEFIDQTIRIVGAVLTFLAVVLATASMTHQRINFAYRLSESGIECCNWKDFPRWMLVGLNWFMGIAALVVICLAGDNPSALLAGILGPGAIGLMSWMMLNSKNYQEMQSDYYHRFFKFSEITEMTLGTNRTMIELLYLAVREGQKELGRGRMYVFFDKKIKQEVNDLIQQRLRPEVPYTVGKIDVLQT